MSAFQFKKATKSQSKLRLGLVGPSGSGKTFTALQIATGLGGSIAVIDSERGSASKYADLFDFDVLELQTFSPKTYVNAIKAAIQARYDVLIIDSLSHAWEGVGGALDTVDKKATQAGANSFTAWKDVTPMHREMVEAILACPCHVIVTMRSKMDYVLEEQQRRGGKKVMVPKKVGMAPIQRQGMEYEFDVVCDLDEEHLLRVTKTRCPEIDEARAVKPGAAFVHPLLTWLGEGTVEDVPQTPPPTPTAEEQSEPKPANAERKGVKLSGEPYANL